MKMYAPTKEEIDACEYCICADTSATCPGGIETLHCDYCQKPTFAVWNKYFNLKNL